MNLNLQFNYLLNTHLFLSMGSLGDIMGTVKLTMSTNNLHIAAVWDTVFFSAVFGAEFGPIPLAKKYVFSPILKENSPQNEVFKKKIGKM